MDGTDDSDRDLRGRLVAAAFGGPWGVVVFLAALVFYGLYWSTGVFSTDSLAFGNALVAVEGGHLDVRRIVYGPSRGATPGMYIVDGRLFARNYGQVLVSLPVLVGLRVASAVADPRLLVVGGWCLAVVGLARVAGARLGHRDRATVLGAGAGLALFVVDAALATELAPFRFPLVALQVTTMVAAALTGVVLYRLLTRLYGPRVGVAVGLGVAVASPVGFWASIPKRHNFTALLAVCTLYAFYRSREASRDPTDPGRGDALRFRALAYVPVGLLAWVHAGEAFVLLLALGAVDVATARSNHPRRLVVVGAVFALSLAPFLLTNAYLTDDPFGPPRTADSYDGEVVPPALRDPDPTGGAPPGGAPTGNDTPPPGGTATPGDPADRTATPTPPEDRTATPTAGPTPTTGTGTTAPDGGTPTTGTGTTAPDGGTPTTGAGTTTVRTGDGPTDAAGSPAGGQGGDKGDDDGGILGWATSLPGTLLDALTSLPGTLLDAVTVPAERMGKAMGKTATVATDPGRLSNVFVRGGYVEGLDPTRDVAVNLTVLESMPLLGVLAVVPVLLARRLRERTATLRDRLAPDRATWWVPTRPTGLSPARGTDLVAVAFLALVAVVYLPRLPIHHMYTVRYLHPVYPLGAYFLARVPAVRRPLDDHPRTLAAAYGTTVLVGVPLYLVTLGSIRAVRSEAVQLYALVALGLAGAVAVWTLATTLTGRGRRLGAVLLGVGAGATSVYLLVGGVELFATGRHAALPVVRYLAESIRIVTG